jgi:hypothetical protein
MAVLYNIIFVPGRAIFWELNHLFLEGSEACIFSLDWVLGRTPGTSRMRSSGASKHGGPLCTIIFVSGRAIFWELNHLFLEGSEACIFSLDWVLGRTPGTSRMRSSGASKHGGPLCTIIFVSGRAIFWELNHLFREGSEACIFSLDWVLGRAPGTFRMRSSAAAKSWRLCAPSSLSLDGPSSGS